MGDGNTLRWSIQNGDLSGVKSIIQKDEEAANSLCNGRPPLCVAADFGQDEVIEFLIQKGADVNANDKYGITPLLSAIFEGHLSSATLLISKGATTTAKAPDGRSYAECAETDELKTLLAQL